MRLPTEHGSFSLTDLPGCSQVCVSHGSFVKRSERGKGHGTRDHKDRLQCIKDLGYDFAICTVVSTNAVQKHILKDSGWEFFRAFISSNSGNVVEIWGRNMNP